MLFLKNTIGDKNITGRTMTLGEWYSYRLEMSIAEHQYTELLPPVRLILHPFSNFFELISPAGYIAATLQ